MSQTKNIIITGASGMVGKSVLLEAIDDERIASILLIGRSSLGMNNPKIKEILLNDFTKIYEHTKALFGYDALIHCMGVSAMGLSEEEYSRLTFDTTKALADTFYSVNPDGVMNYVSGEGTHANSSMMWSRVKSKAEEYVLNKGFSDAYAFRPGTILPERGIKSRTSLYNTLYLVFRPLFPLFRMMNSVTSTSRIGKALINTVFTSYTDKYPVNRLINTMS